MPALPLLDASTGDREMATSIAGPFPPDGSAYGHPRSRAGSIVVYAADQDRAGVVELYVRRKLALLR